VWVENGNMQAHWFFLLLTSEIDEVRDCLKKTENLGSGLGK
jgi:hypothetical protein